MLHLMKVLKAKPKEHVPTTPHVLFTPWGEALDAAHVLEEHPNPQFARETVTLLNGPWKCAFVASGHAVADDLAAVCADAVLPDADSFTHEIVVPFSPESVLSGVGHQLQPDELLWYRRTLAVGELSQNHRLILHFGAVDHACSVRVNGHLVGTHLGGYLPFSFDITAFLHTGDNELAVCVADPSEFGEQPRGKQRFDSGDIWYTAQSGIWQSVWLEEVASAHIANMRIVEATAQGLLRIRMELALPEHEAPMVVCVRVCDGQAEVACAECDATPECELSLAVPDVTVWSPDDPHLYELQLEFGEDRVRSYCGFRTVEVRTDAAGTPRFFLNGEPFFVRGVLDQGYWPDGLLTAPSDEALVYDIEAMRAAGFNTMRKHIKVESARWYYHCDRLGMLVWQDMVSGGAAELDDWTYSYKPTLFKFSWDHYDDTTAAHQARLGSSSERYRCEWTQMCADTICELGNHPSVVIWTLFNEGWGQFDSASTDAMARSLDPTRPIVAASGWYDQGAGDIRGVHNYFRDMAVWPDRKHRRAFMISEFGGYAHRVEGHSAMDDSYGYEVYGSVGEWQAAVRGLLGDVSALESSGLSGFVYTQVSDVEEEVNGILTCNRRVNKMA